MALMFDREPTPDEIRADLKEYAPPKPFNVDADDIEYYGFREPKPGEQACGLESPKDENGEYWTCNQPKGHRSDYCRYLVEGDKRATWLTRWTADDDFWKELGL